MTRRKPLPKSRAARIKLIQKDGGKEFASRMGRTEIDKLLLSLSKTQGLQPEDVEELEDQRYNVKHKYLPDRMKE